MEKQVILQVKCPHCGHSFMDPDHEVNGQPGIKIDIESESGKGFLWLCPIYGCFLHESDITLKENEVIRFNCPHCHNTLARDVLCKTCNAPMVGFNINVGGKVNVCSRKGCQKHYILFEDANDLINLFYEKFEPRDLYM
ncbi:MAG: hypothetical protein K0B08_00975 [Bacteroidales bacterium]|nr:hypothetical protein [Bacteroidales bacterium]